MHVFTIDACVHHWCMYSPLMHVFTIDACIHHWCMYSSHPAICAHDALQWRNNEHDGVSNHRRMDCLLNRLSMHRSRQTSKLRVTCLCAGNSPVTGEFPAPRASNPENISIWWRHHALVLKGPHWWIHSHYGHRLACIWGELTCVQYCTLINCFGLHYDVTQLCFAPNTGKLGP